MFTRHAISPIAVVASRLFRKSLCNLIPRIEGSLQAEVRFDSVLDLVQRESELTRLTIWSRARRVRSLRGKYRVRCESIFAPGVLQAISHKAKSENCGRHAWARAPVGRGTSVA